MKKPKDINNDDELHGQQNDDKRPQVLGDSVQDVGNGHLNSHCIRDIRDLRTHVHEGSNIYEIVKRNNWNSKMLFEFPFFFKKISLGRRYKLLQMIACVDGFALECYYFQVNNKRALINAKFA